MKAPMKTLEMPIKVGDVVAIRLLGGEEVIGRFESETDTKIVLKLPMVFMVQHGPQGQPMASMMPVMLSTMKDVLEFNKNAISVGPVEVAENIKKGYMKETSPIVLPN